MIYLMQSKLHLNPLMVSCLSLRPGRSPKRGSVALYRATLENATLLFAATPLTYMFLHEGCGQCPHLVLQTSFQAVIHVQQNVRYLVGTQKRKGKHSSLYKAVATTLLFNSWEDSAVRE